MRGSPGFTLLEMLVVLAIIALTASFSLGFVGAGGGSSLRRSALAVETTIEATRRAAMVDGRPRQVEIDIEARRIRPDGGREVALRWVDGIRATARRPDLTTDGTFRIVFFPDGSSTGGDLTLTAGEGSARITVDWLSGDVVLDNRGAQR